MRMGTGTEPGPGMKASVWYKKPELVNRITGIVCHAVCSRPLCRVVLYTINIIITLTTQCPDQIIPIHYPLWPLNILEKALASIFVSFFFFGWLCDRT